MNTKHTPGPWGIRSTEDGTAAIFSGETGEWIAYTVKSTPLTQQANAILIAAAPELLESLQKLCAIQEVGDVASWAVEWDAARAAIAKATGG